MHTSRLALLMLICLSLIPLTGCEQKPSKPELSQEGEKKKSPPVKYTVLLKAALFRKAGAGSALPRAIEYFDASSALEFLTGTTSYKKAPALWSYFLCGSVLMAGHLESSRPIVGFYNPYLDGVLLTQWEERDGKHRILAADLRIGSELAGQKSINPNMAWWVSASSQRPLPTVLKEQYAAFMRAFSNRYPANSQEAIQLATGPDAARICGILEPQLAASFANLANLQNPKSPVFHADLAALKKALRSGDAPTLAKLMPANNPITAQGIASQPAWIRQGIVPMYAMTGKTRLIVLLAPMEAPRYCLMAAWVRNPSPHLETLLPYDLDGTAFSVPAKSTRK